MATKMTQGQVESLIDEAIRYEERGDVVLYEQAIRTLDDGRGQFKDGKFVGGRALVAARRAKVAS